MRRLPIRLIEPVDTAGATAGNGTHVLSVAAGVLDGLTPSVPVLLLPAGSTAADVPAGTPIGTIILVKA